MQFEQFHEQSSASAHVGLLGPTVAGALGTSLEKCAWALDAVQFTAEINLSLLSHDFDKSLSMNQNHAQQEE